MLAFGPTGGILMTKQALGKKISAYIGRKSEKLVPKTAEYPSEHRLQPAVRPGQEGTQQSIARLEAERLRLIEARTSRLENRMSKLEDWQARLVSMARKGARVSEVEDIAATAPCTVPAISRRPGISGPSYAPPRGRRSEA
jgi:hypothetical protein